MTIENKIEADKTYIIINKTDLGKTISNIESINDKIATTESSIIEELNNIKNAILVNNKTIYNKSSEIEQNFDTFRKNYNGIINVFKSLIEKYSTLIETGASIINQEIGEIK